MSFVKGEISVYFRFFSILLICKVSLRNLARINTNIEETISIIIKAVLIPEDTPSLSMIIPLTKGMKICGIIVTVL